MKATIACFSIRIITLFWSAVAVAMAEPLSRQTALAEEAVVWQNGNHRFFAGLRYHRELHAAALDVEHRVRRVPLGKDRFLSEVRPSRFSSGQFRQGAVGSKCVGRLEWPICANQLHCRRWVGEQRRSRRGESLLHSLSLSLLFGAAVCLLAIGHLRLRRFVRGIRRVGSSIALTGT